MSGVSEEVYDMLRHPGTTLISWWVSWCSAGPFEYHGPWWISGFEAGESGRSTICAAVMAADEDDARQVIVDAHDDEPDIEWRFVEAQTPEWSPFTGRFPRADWMRWPGGPAVSADVSLGHRQAPWRVGRKLGRTVYERRFFDRPSDDDRFLGIFDHGRDAELVVALHNAHPDVLCDDTPPTVAATADDRPSLAVEIGLLLRRRSDVSALDREHIVDLVIAFERWRAAEQAERETHPHTEES